MVPCEITAEEILFEWQHHRISFTNSKIGTTYSVNVLFFTAQLLDERNRKFALVWFGRFHFSVPGIS